tara:strand:- start:167 stop:613 length:447 start_codon:yes stop_codon:yes gene_type:complete
MLDQPIKVVIIAFALALISACSSPATTIPTANGNTLAGNNAAVTNSYADIPISADDELVLDMSLLLNTGEQWIGRAVLKSKLDTQEAFEYYLANMPNTGWIKLTSVQSENSVLTYEKGRRYATIQINDRVMWGSLISVTVAPRDAIDQ